MWSNLMNELVATVCKGSNLKVLYREPFVGRTIHIYMCVDENERKRRENIYGREKRAEWVRVPDTYIVCASHEKVHESYKRERTG